VPGFRLGGFKICRRNEPWHTEMTGILAFISKSSSVIPRTSVPGGESEREHHEGVAGLERPYPLLSLLQSPPHMATSPRTRPYP
jgi:hypothetical protein